MIPWTNKGKNTGYLVAPSKVTLVFELSTFDDIPVLDTTSGAQLLRGADQAGHKMEVDMQSHPHQIVSINLVAFIKRFLDVWFCNFEKHKCLKEVVKNLKKERHGAFRIAWTQRYKDCKHFMLFQRIFRRGCELFMQAPIIEYPQLQQ